jgi:hypothetical protein
MRKSINTELNKFRSVAYTAKAYIDKHTDVVDVLLGLKNVNYILFNEANIYTVMIEYYEPYFLILYNCIIITQPNKDIARIMFFFLLRNSRLNI